jgi:hypothetical protein
MSRGYCTSRPGRSGGAQPLPDHDDAYAYAFCRCTAKQSRAGGASAARAAGGTTTSPPSCPGERGAGSCAARRSARSGKWSRQPFAEGGSDRPRSPRGGRDGIRLGDARIGRRLQFWISTTKQLRARPDRGPTRRPQEVRCDSAAAFAPRGLVPGDCSSARATAQARGRECRVAWEADAKPPATAYEPPCASCVHSFRAEREVHLRVRVSGMSAECQWVVVCSARFIPARN